MVLPKHYLKLDPRLIDHEDDDLLVSSYKKRIEDFPSIRFFYRLIPTLYWQIFLILRV